MNNKVTIVMYHYVRELLNSRYPNIKGLDIEKFKNQLNYLIKNFTIVKMEDLIDAINLRSTLPNNAAILTFDDGYVDHFTQVLPVLFDKKIQGSFFIPSRLINENIVLDVNKIHFILEETQDTKKLISFLLSRLDYYRLDYNLETNEYYFNKLAKPNRFDNKDIIFIKRILQTELNIDLRKKIINEMFLEFFNTTEVVLSKELYLSYDQIKMMKNCGMFIGAHSHNHFWFESLNENQQTEEIEKSVSFLTKIGVDKNHRVMCYPYGSYNNTTIKILKNYNFQCAFTTIPSIANIKLDNRFSLPRFDTNDIKFK